MLCTFVGLCSRPIGCSWSSGDEHGLGAKTTVVLCHTLACVCPVCVCVCCHICPVPPLHVHCPHLHPPPPGVQCPSDLEWRNQLQISPLLLWTLTHFMQFSFFLSQAILSVLQREAMLPVLQRELALSPSDISHTTGPTPPHSPNTHPIFTSIHHWQPNTFAPSTNSAVVCFGGQLHGRDPSVGRAGEIAPTIPTGEPGKWLPFEAVPTCISGISGHAHLAPRSLLEQRPALMISLTTPVTLATVSGVG